ncbi:MAG TPA: hypothetical protein VMX17_02365 [Candidatus Glassbacteria bacterium]|nr:hypothetical protein [Candidatus Glassbacteria bacterium]
MKTVSCPNCGVVYQLEFEHFYGKICKCGYDIPSDGDIEIVIKNRIKNKKTKQKALDSVARKLRGES